MRLIDADLLKENWKCNFDHRRRLVELFDEQPTIEAAPVVHGKWIMVSKTKHDNETEIEEKCSKCNRHVYRYETQPKDNFCPSCGARMDVDDYE